MIRLILAVSLACMAPTALAAPPSAGSDEARDLGPYQAWFSQQHSAYGMSCCSVADGREVDVREEHGRFLVRFLHLETISGVRPDPAVWYPVPEEAILRGPNPTGRAIAWWSPYPFTKGDGPHGGHIRCFINAEMY
ncbi:MAG TPA: hypothetical protein VMI52_02870 [Acetobacteraceae bacterium]|nr:hypothetical protein [Acetobacteraceae bacterium]